MTTNNNFEKFFPRPFKFSDKAHELETMSKWNDAKITWELSLKAATTEANKRIAELEREVAEWKNRLNAANELFPAMNQTSNRLIVENTELQASNNRLREALEDTNTRLNEMCDVFYKGATAKDRTVISNNYDLLSATPAQSLSEHDKAIYEQIAIDLDKHMKTGVAGNIVRAMRDMKHE